jgi:hypothetical protein
MVETYSQYASFIHSEAANCAAIQITSQYFMEHEGSWPCSQEPSTGPYHELDRSSPYHSILSH